MTHDEILEKLNEKKIIAIVRGVSPDRILDVAKALEAGGVTAIEAAFDHKSEDGIQKTLECIRILSSSNEYSGIVGAGTVLTKGEVKMAADAGAKYMISPNMNPDVIRNTRAKGLVSMPGCLTPTEIEEAYMAGADIVKVYPAGLMGAAYLKALMAPLGYIKYSAVGNVGAENLRSFLEIGISSFGIGGSLIDKKAIAEGRYEVITERAKELTSIMEEYFSQKNCRNGDK
ncbi:MAG: bifunctional 4-hydroxy-2-oxoglutarate aldolase/2-dehydro-3-deoxy-phosphogluconate aldolase [Eubacteriales bacterium]|jgi:2-dehydro-3-deoxyphosphogluconate aldolase/(4S)-4-hydroxy-2-oxoglutarate aldolase